MKSFTQKAALVGLAGLMGGVAQANADIDLPHVYGRIDLSVNSTELNSRDDTGALISGDRSINTNSNASRLGLQNTHKLNDDLSVFYRLEYEINPFERLRSSSKGMLRQRNSVVGLKGSYGSLFFGVHDTPMKKTELKVDLFSDYHLADIDEVLAGQDRTSDTINYKSPKMNGFQFWAMLIPGDDKSTSPGSDDTSGASDAVAGDGVADAVSGSVIYKADDLQLALAYNSELNGLDLMRLSAQYKLGATTLGAIIQQAERSDGTGSDGLGAVVSAKFALTSKDVIKLQYVTADNDAQEESAGSDMLTIGVDHKLAKSTKLFAYYSDRSNDDPSKEFSTFGVGMRHEFGKKK